ncbi:MAG: hypothetical protein ACLRYF_04710 [Mediterraneibacter faecis]
MKNLTKIQTLFMIVALAIVATIIDKTICQLYNANQISHLYPLTTTVAEIKNDTVTVEDSNGNLWSFDGAEDWEINDSCALIMNDNNTKDIRDDVIISTRYQGRMSKISDIAYIERSSDNSYTVEDLNGNFHILFTDSDDGCGNVETENID